MRTSKVIIVTVLSFVVILCITGLVIYLEKRFRQHEEGSEPEKQATKLSHQDEVAKLEQKLADLKESQSQRLQEAQEKLRKEREDDIAALAGTLKEIGDQQIRDFSEAFKKKLFGDDIDPDGKNEPKLGLILDVNLPKIGSATYTTSGLTVTINNEDSYSPETVRFSHSLRNKVYTLDRVSIGGRRYPIVPIHNVLSVIAHALKEDLGFPLYLMVYQYGGDVFMLENTGSEFVKSDLTVVLPENLKKKAAELGRRYKIVDKEMVLDLIRNTEFTIKDKKFLVNENQEFGGDFVSYTYHMNGGSFEFHSFEIGNRVQTHLPIDKEYTAITVYFHKDFLNMPLLIRFTNGNEHSYYLNNLHNNWVVTVPKNLGEQVYNLSLVANHQIVFNVARRSDYFRNGRGKSDHEVTKDVVVVVHPDEPIAGWTTYVHQLESQAKFVKFRVLKSIYSDQEVLQLPNQDIDSLYVYMKSDQNLRTMPPALSVVFVDETRKYYVLNGDKYEENPAITSANLEKQLETL